MATTKKQKASMNGIIAVADVLAEQHVTYTDHYVTRANDELYKLLGGMMGLCIDVQGSKCKDQIIKQMRKTIAEKYCMKTQAKSTVASIVVRYVIGTGRKTAHVYGRVIQSAIDAGITPAMLPDHILANGGIDAIRKKGVAAQAARTKADDATQITVRDRLVNMLREKSVNSLGTIKLANGKHELKMLYDVTEFTYLICSNSSKTGELEVVAVAYPTHEIENKILDNYATSMQLAALQHTNVFHNDCQKLNANANTVITWREANGIATAADALEQTCRMGAYVSDEECRLIIATEDYKKKMERDKCFADFFEFTDKTEEITA